MNKLVFGTDCEQQVIRLGPSYMQLQNQLGFGPPLFIAMCMLSAKGFTMVQSETTGPHGLINHGGVNLAPIDQDALLAPEVLVEGEGADIQRLLRPAFDTFWQASGWPGSQSYDANGKWVGHATLFQG